MGTGDPVETLGPNWAEPHPLAQVWLEIAGPDVGECFARWQQHLARQQAAASEEVSHCAVRGASEASHTRSAIGITVQRRWGYFCIPLGSEYQNNPRSVRRYNCNMHSIALFLAADVQYCPEQ